jgi:hypothetical protein
VDFSQEHEGRVRPLLEAVFKTKPGGTPVYELNCHGLICKVTIVEGQHPPDDWVEMLQETQPGTGRFAEISFIDSNVYLLLEEPGREAGIRLLNSIAETFAHSSKFIDCKAMYTGSKTNVVLSLSLNQRREIEVSMSGDGASTAAGGCLHHLLSQITEGNSVGAGVAAGPSRSLHVELP